MRASRDEDVWDAKLGRMVFRAEMTCRFLNVQNESQAFCVAV